MHKPKPQKRELLAVALRTYVLRAFAICARFCVTISCLQGSVTATRLRAYIRAGALAVIFALLALTMGLTITGFKPAHTTAATSSTLNFQARLMSIAGSVAADGNYNIRFKLYDASTSGTLLWTEARTNASSTGVTVRNGYVTVNLGSVTPFPTTINWDQQLWLTMDVGGTSTGAVTYDGEMSPRLQLTAVPYAFKANQLAQYNQATGFTSTLSLVQPTGGNQTFQVPDQGAAGTYNLLTTASANTGYIQNTAGSASPQSSANFNIQATSSTTNGTIAGILRGAAGGQTVDLLQFQNTAGSVISRVTAAGRIGVNSATASSELSVIPDATTTTGILIKGVASQTANLLEAQDSTGAVVTRISATGVLGSGDTSTASTNSGNTVIQSGNATGTTSNSGNVSIDAGTATGTKGQIQIGTTSASSILEGRGGITTTNQGAVTVSQLLTATGGLTVGTGTVFTNPSATLNTTLASLGDFPTGGSIGLATATVDIATTITLAQTTNNKSVTVPNPTNNTAGRILYISNVGTVSVTITNVSLNLNAGGATTLLWNGTAWTAAGTDAANGNYVNNSTSLQVGANFNIGATGQASVSFLSPLIDTVSGGTTLSVGTGNATAITLGKAGVTTTAGGALTVTGLTTASNGLTVTGATGITGATTINTSGALSTNIGNAGSATTVLGTVGINNSGTATTTIGFTGGTTNIAGTTGVTGTTNINSSGTATTTIGAAGGTTNIAGTTGITGITNVNTSGSAATNIATGTYNGTLSVGNASSTTTILGVTNIGATGSAAIGIANTSYSGTLSIGNVSSTTSVLGITNVGVTGSSAINIASTSYSGTVSLGNAASTLNIQGATNVNVSGSTATNIGTGSYSGTVAIGNAAATANINGAVNINTTTTTNTAIGNTTGTLQLTSNHFTASTAGALGGITGYTQVSGSALYTQVASGTDQFKIQAASGLAGSVDQAIIDNTTTTTGQNNANVGNLNLKFKGQTTGGGVENQALVINTTPNSVNGGITDSLRITSAQDNITGSTQNALKVDAISSSLLGVSNAIYIGTGWTSLLTLGSTQLISGTGILQSPALSGTYTNALTLNNSGNTIYGNGANLTALNGTNVTSGTIADARLTTNVALYNATTANFTGTLQMGGSTVCVMAANCVYGSNVIFAGDQYYQYGGNTIPAAGAGDYTFGGKSGSTNNISIITNATTRATFYNNGDFNLAAGNFKQGGTTIISSTGVLQNVTYNGNIIGAQYGGTGANTFTTNGVIYGNGSGTLGVTGAGTTGQCLISTTSSAPVFGSCAGSGSGATLQAAYNNDVASTPDIVLDSTRTSVDIQGYSGQVADLLDLRSYTAAGLGAIQFGVSPGGAVTEAGALTVTAGGANITGGLVAVGNSTINSSAASGNTTIGNGSNTLQLNSNTFNLSTAGAITGLTGITPGVTNTTDVGSASLLFRTGFFGTSVLTNLLDTPVAGGTLALGTTNATGGINLNQNTTVLSGKNLTVTSGTTSFTGTTNINTTGTATTTIGNIAGPSTTAINGTLNINTAANGNTSIGNGTGTFALNSSAFKVTTAGVLSGITGYLQSSGNATFTQAAGGTTDQVKIQAAAGTANNIDQLLIDNTAFTNGQTNAGANNLNLKFKGSTTTAVENGSLRVDLTPGTFSGSTANGLRVVASTGSTAGVIQNGLKIDAKTAGAGTDNGIYIGTGWDTILNYNNGVADVILIDGTGHFNLNQVVNTLGVANGGTGLSTTPTNGQLLIGNGAGYTLGTIGVANGLTITNGAGTISLGLTYGALANTAAQGNTSISFTGAGNLTGGLTGTAGGGFTANTLNTVQNPTFTTSVTSPAFTGTGAVTVSSGGTSDLTLQSASGNIVSNGQVQRAFTRTVPTTVGNEVDLGSFAFTNGAGSLYISVTVPSAGFSVAKEYNIPINYNGTANAWASLQPISDTGGYTGNDFALEVNINNGTASLRIRRTLGATAGTANITIIQQGVNTDAFTASTATAAAAAPVAYYNAAVLGQVGGAAYIQGDLFVANSGNLNVGGSQVITSGKVLQNIASVNQTLLATTTNNFDLGSTGTTWRSGYFGTSVLTPLLDTITAGGTLALGTNNATGGINLNQNTTVATGKTFTVTNGATSLTGGLTVSGTTSITGATTINTTGTANTTIGNTTGTFAVTSNGGFNVTTAGIVTAGTYNLQTISSAANFTGTVAVATSLSSPIITTASGALALNTGTAAAVNIGGGSANAVNLNQNTTVATGKTFTVTNGATSLTGSTTIVGNTTINTAAGNGTTNIGNASNTLQLSSNTFNLSTGGAITGVTSYAQTGYATFSQGATDLFKIQAAAIPTTDMAQITNSGFPITADGINAQQIDYYAGLTGAAFQSSAQRINITNTSTVAGSVTNGLRIVATGAVAGTTNGIKIDNFTSGGGGASAVYVGTGWKDLLSYNGLQVINGTGQLNLGSVFGQLNIAGGTNVTGTLATANGGTGLNTFAATNGVLYSTNSSTLAVTAASGGSNFCLQTVSAGSAPIWASCSTGSVTGSGTANHLSKFSATGSVLTDSQILDNGTNVGIGTSGVPSALLSVGGTTGNFTVSTAGGLTATGAAVTGTTSFNTSGAAGTSIGNASSATSIQGPVSINSTVAGTTTIGSFAAATTALGNSTGNFSINSNHFTVSTAGALAGITGYAQGSGSATYSLGSSDVVSLTSTAAPTTYLQTLSNSGFNPTATGTGLQSLTFTGKPSGTNIQSAQLITITNANNTAGGQVNGIEINATGAGANRATDTVGLSIDNLASNSGGTTNENAIEVGTNWDNVLVAAGNILINGSGLLNAANTYGQLADTALSNNVALYNRTTSNFSGALQQGGNTVCTMAANCSYGGNTIFAGDQYFTYGGNNIPAAGTSGDYTLGSIAGHTNNVAFITNGTTRLQVLNSGDINVSTGGIQLGGSQIINSSKAIQVGVTADTALLTTGTLGVARGGTGAATFTQYGVIYGNNATNLSVTAAGTTGQCFVATTGAAPSFQSCTGAVSGAANQALSNLASVAINTSLLPGVTNTIDAGSAALAFRTGYFGTSLQSPLLDTPSGTTTLNIGTTNATTGINLNQNTTILSGKNLTVANGTTSFSGTPTASATSSLIQTGTAIAGGNAVANGGTYYGLNAPSSGAGSAADFLNFQYNGSSRLLVTNAGNITGGTFNGQTISAAASFTGTLAVTTLGAANTATLLCRNATNQIASCNTTGTGAAYVQGGNNFGAAYVLGSTDNFGLSIKTNNTNRATFDTGGNLNLLGVNLQQNGTTFLDTSRNLTNIGTYGGAGNITTTGGILSVQGAGNNYFAGNVGIGTAAPQGTLTVEKAAYTTTEVLFNNGVTGAPPAYPLSYTPTLTVQTAETTGSRPLFFGYNNAGTWDAFLTTGACGSFTSMCLDLGTGSTAYTAIQNSGTTLNIAGGSDGNFTNVSFQNSGTVGIGVALGSQKLDVQGGNINTSGAIMTGGTQRLSSTGVLSAITGYTQTSGTATFNQGAGDQLLVTSGTNVPTADQINIDNTASTGVTTAGVNGLSISYKGGAAAVESSAERIDLQPGATSGGTWNGTRIVANATGPVAGVTLNGIKLEAPTSAGAGTANALFFTAGWNSLLKVGTTTVINGAGALQDTALSGTYSTNALTFSNASNSYSGTWNGNTISVAKGGTGAATFTQNGVIYGNTAGALQVTAAGTTGQCLVGNTGAAPTWGSCSSGSITGSGTANTVPIYTGTGTTLGNSIITQSGTTAIGIGTSGTPASLLSVGGTTGNFQVNSSGQAVAGTIATGFGTILTNNTIIGTTHNGTVGINTGAGAGTLRLDAAGVLQNITGYIQTSGNATFTQAAATSQQVLITQAAGLATGTTDQFVVDNTNFTNGQTNAGVNNINAKFKGSTTTAVENGSIRVDLTPGTFSGSTTNGLRVVSSAGAAAGVTQNGFKVDAITATAGVNNALYVGSGWTNILNYNGTTVIDGTGHVNVGNATGTLGTGFGGTGLSTYTTNGVFYASSTSAQAQTVGTSAQILQANGTGIPGFVSLGGDVTVAVGGTTTIGAGTVTGTKIANNTITNGNLLSSNAYTNINGVGTLTAGSITSFGSIATGNTISGTTINATTGINTGGTLRLDSAGVLQAITGYTQTSGTFSLTSAATSGNAVGFTDNSFTTTGSSLELQTFKNANATATATTVNGLSIAASGTASGNNTINAVNLQSVTAIAGNTFTGINIGANYTNGVVVNAIVDINGTGQLNLGTVANNSVTGNLTVTNGGTGATTLTQNGILLGNGTNAVTAIAPVATGQCLLSTGVGSAPAFGTCPSGGAGGIINSTSLQTPGNFYIQAANSGVNGTIAGIFRGAAGGQTTDLVQFLNSAGTGNPLARVGSFGDIYSTSTITTGSNSGLGGQLGVATGASASIGEIIKGFGAQTGDLLQLQSSGGAVLSSITGSGDLLFGNNGGHAIAVSPSASGSGGQYLSISAGNGTGTNQAGGNLFLTAGANTGTGTGGSVVIKDFTSQASDLLQLQSSGGTTFTRFDSAGSLFLNNGNILVVGQDSPTGVNVRTTLSSFYGNNIALVVKGVSGQTSNLQEFQDNVGNPLSAFNSTGYLALGNNTATSVLTITHTETNTTGAAQTYGNYTVTPASAPGASATYNGIASVVTASGANLNTNVSLVGDSSNAINTGASGLTLGGLTGTAGTATNSGTGNVFGASGGSFNIQNTGTGTTSYAQALFAGAPTVSAGSISIESGLYIAAQKVTGVGTAYGINQVGTSDLNLFAGATSIQNTSTTAFQVQTAAGGSTLFTADTSNMKIIINNPSASSGTSTTGTDSFNSGGSALPAAWTLYRGATDTTSATSYNSAVAGDLRITPKTTAALDCYTGTLNCVRVLEASPTSDFTAETKVDTNSGGNGSSGNAYGIFVSTDATCTTNCTFLRIEKHQNSGSTYQVAIYGATAGVADNGGTGTWGSTTNIGNSAPVYIRVVRTANLFTVTYSLNGTAWNSVASFTKAAQVQTGTNAKIGVHYDDGAADAVATTADFDYFNLSQTTGTSATALAVNGDVSITSGRLIIGGNTVCDSTGCSVGSTGGANTTLSNLGATAINADLNFTTGADRNVGVAQSTSGVGNNLILTAAQGQASSNSTGGNLVLQAGAGGGSGTQGSVVVKSNGTNSTTAFQVQTTGGAAVLTADTSNSRVYVGATTAGATPGILVLGNKNTSGDPTGIDGAMYYNSTTKEMRCYLDGGWTNCGGKGVEYTDVEDDFLGHSFGLNGNTGIGQLNWTANSTTNGITTNTQDTDIPGHPGIAVVETNLSGTLSSTAGGEITLPIVDPADLNRMQWVVEMPTAADNTNITYRVGLLDPATPNSQPANGIYFQFSGAGANWKAVTRSAGTETNNDTGVVAATAKWFLLEIRRNTAGNYEFWVNDALVATNTTNKPSGGGSAVMRPMIEMIQNTTTTQRQMWIDYFRLRSNRLGSRYT